MSLTRNAISVTECLQLAVTPRVKNPVLCLSRCFGGVFLSCVPAGLGLGHQVIKSVRCVIFDVLATRFEKCAKLLSIPLLVGLSDVVIPVLLNKGLEVFAVSSSGMRNVVVGKPALKLGFMPLVVYCASS